jgi:putative serine protease PepD
VSTGKRGRRARNHGWPTLVIVAVIAALVGAIVASAVVVTNKNDSSDDNTNALTSTSTQSASTAASLPAGSVASVAAALLPSVVSITVSGHDEQDEGTGIILSGDGNILTNNHVVEAAATSGVIAVTFSNGKTVTATIVGRDPTSDLAVIKAANVTGLHPATLGSDSSLVVGQQVIAVGSPLGLSNTVTSGIISSLNRPVCTQNCGGSGSGTTPTVLDAIQTDAAINPGNSGGPLVDMAGRVVGINSAIATLDQSLGDSQSGNIGVGFAIPIDEAKRIAIELQKTGHADHALFGIGVADSVDSNLNTPNGAKIVSVTPDGPAAKAGLKVGDIVIRFGNRSLIDADSLIAATHAADPNSTVTITYLRGGQQASVQVTLGAASSG